MGSSSGNSVTYWLDQLKAGDPRAAKPLWDGYFTRLVELARARLRSVQKASADEEDVALSAFASFCRAVEKGRFPRLDDRDDLWQVLFLITARKASALGRRERRAKWGAGRVVNASVVVPEGSIPDLFAVTAGAEPSPEFVAEVAEECGRMLGQLGDEKLRSVAVWKMEGYTNEEIARKINRSIPTVERKLALIRETWERDGRR